MLLSKLMPFSKSANKSVPVWVTGQPIAHRGLHDIEQGISENSVSAFSHALTRSYAIEFDVQLSSDGHPVIMHDTSLMRTTGDPRLVSDVPLCQLVKLPLEGTKDTVPPLQSVLDLVQGQVPLVIEIKPGGSNRKIYVQRVLDVLSAYEGPMALQSFDPRLLGEVRRQAPHITRGQLGMWSPPSHLPFHKKMMIRHLILNSISQPHYIGYDADNIQRASVRRKLPSQMPLLAWTVDNKIKMENAQKYADNIIFEKLPPESVQAFFNNKNS
jgi:glycerophosphoryl diester phosphodiesterase